MKRTISIQTISIALITLWLYTGLSKLMEIEMFKIQLARQEIIADYANLLVWLLPALEILAALFLMFTITRKTGMLLSFSLITVFTAYMGLVAFGFIKTEACACGGVLARLGFKEHFWFNLFFACLTGLGILLLFHDKWRFLIRRKTRFRLL